MQILKNIKDVIGIIFSCWVDYIEQERAHKRRVKEMRRELDQFKNRLDMERSLKEFKKEN